MIHLSEVKELNIKLFANEPSQLQARKAAFYEAVEARIRAMAAKGEPIGFLSAKEVNVSDAKAFHAIVEDLNMLYLPYFRVTNLNSQIRIDAIKI